MHGLPENVVLEEVACPNGCPPSDEFVLEGRDVLCGVPGVFRICRCRQCGLERTNPRPTPETIGAYYPQSYSPYTNDTELPSPEGPGLKKRLLRWLGLNARQLPDRRPGTMLELGCSTGRYMEFARTRGWQVEGVEYSAEAAATARAKGFHVINMPLEDVTLEDRKYDLVAAWMVIEHLHDPVAALRKVGRAMAPGGVLVGSVPDTASLMRYAFREYSYDLQLPTHLYHFTTRSFAALLSTAGWQVERIVWQRNCQTFLKSLSYWAQARRFDRLRRAADWVSTNPRAGKLRALLNIVFGATRLSGRIEFHARRKDAG